MMTPVSIVILSYNRLDELSKNLPRILDGRDHPDDFEIIVVDNNSNDGSREFLIDLQKQNPELILVLNEDNRGVGGGRNSGWVKATRDFIVALDDDTSISVEDLKRVPQLFAKYKKAGLLAFKVVHPVTNDLQNPHGDVACEVANHHGAGFTFRRRLFTEIGGIDEGCDYGAEEFDFAMRMRIHGWGVKYIPELTVYHNTQPRDLSTEKKRRIRRQYNNVRIYHKYFPRYMALRNSIRYGIVVTRSWMTVYGCKELPLMLKAFLQGMKDGIAIYKPIPRKVVGFYNNPKLRPEFGNYSLIIKGFKSLFGK